MQLPFKTEPVASGSITEAYYACLKLRPEWARRILEDKTLTPAQAIDKVTSGGPAQVRAFRWRESVHRTVTQSKAKQDWSSVLRICVHLCPSVVLFCKDTAQRLLSESFAEEDDVGSGQDPAHEPGQAPEYPHKEDVQHGGSHEDNDPGLEEGGQLHGAVEGVDPKAERDADMPIAHLRGIDDLGFPAPGIVESKYAVGQDHQPTAEPAQVLGADEAAVDAGQPVHEPIRAEVNGISADGGESPRRGR